MPDNHEGNFQASADVPRRIGIVLIGIEKHTLPALQYLLLQINRLQRTYELELLPEAEKFFALLTSEGALDRTKVKDDLPALVKAYREHLVELAVAYKLQEEIPNYFVLISLAKFADDYYTTRKENASVIALGNWQRYMAPPTQVEFLLTLTVREVISAICPRLRGSVHLGTKGCICDFTYHLSEARFKVLGAFVCGYCRKAMEMDDAHGLADEVEKVLSKKWLGKPGDFASHASISSKLGHHLFITKAMTPTAWEKLKATVEDETYKQVAKWLIYLISLIVVLIVGWSVGKSSGTIPDVKPAETKASYGVEQPVSVSRAAHQSRINAPGTPSSPHPRDG